jgi:hypothetical protein
MKEEAKRNVKTRNENDLKFFSDINSSPSPCGTDEKNFRRI